MNKKILILFVLMSSICMSLFAQPENWFNLDPEDDKVPGVSTERMYDRLVQGKKGAIVIVAVLDSGVDSDHEDLKDVMWVNADEIPNNGLDDDNNGYVDDIHGWNFLGNAKGENIQYDNLELTRLYRKLRPKYENVDSTQLSGKKLEEFRFFKKLEADLKTNQEKEAQNKIYETLYEGLKQLKSLIGKEEITMEDVEGFETDNPLIARTAALTKQLMQQGNTFGEVLKELEGAYNYFMPRYNYYYNPDFDPRDVIGDDYSNPNDRDYGNNDVEGPDAMHGTAVAGTIAGDRDNDLGIMGVANNVRIMAVRTVPDGDERDKDVANAIRYAVDNGASIINMSFGKGYAWDKKAVDKAVKYAAKKDVLLIHAAGNDGKENFTDNNFPNDKYKHKGFLGLGAKSAANWLEVGALNFEMGENLVANFSNYSANNVDVFAPGVQLELPIPNNEYESVDGTSFAAPVVAGVAAMLRSYFPALTAEQVKKVIMDSSIQPDGKVAKPSSGEVVPFKELSVSGGMVNAFNAMIKAAEVKGKKRVKKQEIIIIP